MNLWKADPLRCGRDLMNRFFFRLLWCSAGLVIGLIVFRNSRLDPWLFIPFIFMVPALGAALDLYRLKHPARSPARIWSIACAAALLTLAAFFLVGLFLKSR